VPRPANKTHEAVEGLKVELERVADLKAQAEAEAIEHWATGIQKLVDDMAKRFSLNWRPMPHGQAENLVRRFMEANGVSASEIEGRELSIVVMNMVADEKERMEKEKARLPKSGFDFGSPSEEDTRLPKTPGTLAA
jgi:hypothetical protein